MRMTIKFVYFSIFFAKSYFLKYKAVWWKSYQRFQLSTLTKYIKKDDSSLTKWTPNITVG